VLLISFEIGTQSQTLDAAPHIKSQRSTFYSGNWYSGVLQVLLLYGVIMHHKPELDISNSIKGIKAVSLKWQRVSWYSCTVFVVQQYRITCKMSSASKRVKASWFEVDGPLPVSYSFPLPVSYSFLLPVSFSFPLPISYSRSVAWLGCFFLFHVELNNMSDAGKNSLLLSFIFDWRSWLSASSMLALNLDDGTNLKIP
jgi:hypothetical protein